MINYQIKYNMRINIKEFQQSHELSLIPEDIMSHFTQCLINGEDETDIRDSVPDEMRIREIYNRYPELRPQDDWEVRSLFSFLTDLMKSVIRKEDLLSEKTDELLRKTGIILDRFKVENRPTDEIEYIYDTILWLKSEVL